MSDADKTRPEDRVRRIEEEAEYLEHDLDKAREAVQRARRAATLAPPGQGQTVPEAEPQPEDETEEDQA